MITGAHGTIIFSVLDSYCCVMGWTSQTKNSIDVMITFTLRYCVEPLLPYDAECVGSSVRTSLQINTYRYVQCTNGVCIWYTWCSKINNTMLDVTSSFGISQYYSGLDIIVAWSIVELCLASQVGINQWHICVIVPNWTCYTWPWILIRMPNDFSQICV